MRHTPLDETTDLTALANQVYTYLTHKLKGKWIASQVVARDLDVKLTDVAHAMKRFVPLPGSVPLQMHYDLNARVYWYRVWPTAEDTIPPPIAQIIESFL